MPLWTGRDQEELAIKEEATIIGVDLVKQVFQLHGATAEGEVVFRKKLSRKWFCVLMQAHPTCIVAVEACATAYHWVPTLVAIGHDVRPIADAFRARGLRSIGARTRLSGYFTIKYGMFAKVSK